jgi:hypothetical protein
VTKSKLKNQIETYDGSSSSSSSSSSETESDSDTEFEDEETISELEEEVDDEEYEDQDEDDFDETDLNTSEITVTHVYRSERSKENHKYNYFFIDERKKTSKTKHFVLFINEYKSDESKKTNGIELNLNQFFPLNSEDASQKLLNAIEEKILNETIQISYISKDEGNIIKSIELI